MGKIGLIDVDGHHFPNLALMRISAFHKSIGDTVEWCRDGIERFDKVYVSKVFSDTYSKDIDFTPNAEKVIRGGTGYQIHLSGERERDTTPLRIAFYHKKLSQRFRITHSIHSMILQSL